MTYVFYEAEEIDDKYNGLQARRERPRPARGRLRDPDGAQRRGRRGRLPGHPARRRAPRAVSGPTPRAPGRAQRDPQAGEVLRRLAEYDARKPVIDGLEYHEGLNAV